LGKNIGITFIHHFTPRVVYAVMEAKIAYSPFSGGYAKTPMKGIDKVRGEFSLTFLAYNMKRVINILGTKELIEAIEAR